MGREIRRVPPNYEHPKNPGKPDRYIPVHDCTFDNALSEWIIGYNSWKAGNHPDQKHLDTIYDFVDWFGAPPDPRKYCTDFGDTATWYQMYETVSEGTPVSPPFETKGQLIDYLVDNGDFWDQKRGAGGWDRDAASSFVAIGWSPSLVIYDGE